MQLRIGVVDDHPAVVLGTTAIINAQSDMAVVAAASSARRLLDLNREIDLVLLDLLLPDSTPSENIAALQEAGIRIIVFTSGDDAGLIRVAARAGVEGLVLKTADAATLLEAIRSVARGEIVGSGSWAAAIDADVAFVSAGLTLREAEVLALYAAGETAEGVARLLFIATTTVHDYIRRIRAKYAAVDRAAPSKVDLYRRAMEDGLLPSGSEERS